MQNIREQSRACISVVMCTYNGTRYLESQLQSLLAQSLLPCEVIVCDDQSNDDTVVLLNRFSREAPFPVRILVNPVNLGSTRNFDGALQMATGDYLALCDQDDLWFPEKLATLAGYLDSAPDVGGVFSDATIMDGTGAQTHGNRTLWELHGFTRRKQALFVADPTRLLLKHDVVTGATLMVRANLRAIWHPIPASWVHDGWITWMLAVHSSLALVPAPLVAYRTHAQQQLGVGGASRLQRWKAMRSAERLRYARVADQFADLRRHLQSCTTQPALLHKLACKIILLRRRAQLPRSFPARIVWILRDLPGYWRYARGWRSLRKDLLL